MVKLKNIKIVGFKSEDINIEVNLSSEKVSILYGENGCGKTTFLRVLHAVLSEKEDVLIKEKVRDVYIDYYYDDDEFSISIKKLDNDLIVNQEFKYYIDNSGDKVFFNTAHSGNIYYEVNNSKGIVYPNHHIRYSNYNWDEYKESKLYSSSSILFGVNRGISLSNIRLSSDEIYQIITKNGRIRSHFNTKSDAMEFSELFSNILLKSSRMKFRQSSIHNSQIVKFKDEHVLIDNLSIDSVEELLLERYRLAKRLTYERVQNALFDTLSLYINTTVCETDVNIQIDDDELIELIANNKISLIEALKNTSDNIIKKQLIELLDNYDKQKLNNLMLKTLLFKMINEIEAEKVILNSINKLLQYFNEELSEGKELVVNTDEAYIQLKNEKTHSLNELSSGERHLLTFLTISVIEGSQRTFLFIDEPEISLNLKWQRKLVQLFNELLPNSQLIFASHSPSISKDKTSYLVKMEVM